MTWIAFPVIIKTFAKFSFPSLSMEDVHAQANAWNQHWGRGGYGSNTCFHEPTNGAKFKLCFPETLINYDRDWRCSGKRDIWISISPPPLFSLVIMNQVGLVTKLTVNNTLMLNSQQRWNSIVNHSGVRPSGHGQGIVWSELLWYLRLIQAVLPDMKERRSGCIINNTSYAGIVGVPFSEIYSSSKFAVEGLTEAMAPTLLHFNIR